MNLISLTVNGKSRSGEVALRAFYVRMRLQNLGFTEARFGCNQIFAAGASR
jgi:aerobic-type carbon monoxide dehydrogenase small subunit (CoxS/CutS family)